MQSGTPAQLVTLRGGFVVDWALVQVLLDLEDRGATFALDGERGPRVSPEAVMTDRDKAVLDGRPAEVRSLIEYIVQADWPL
jgi:hypothetical protein